MRERHNKREYYVKWAHYSIAEATWEPLSHLQHSQRILQEFEASQGRRLSCAKKAAPAPERRSVRQIWSVEEWFLVPTAGSFRTHSVERVLSSTRIRSDLYFEVQWRPINSVTVPRSLVSFAEFRKNDAKTLADYLSQFV